jgi:hypothetical protein
MAARRFSQLQKRLLAWLALDEQRTRGMISRSHQDLVGALRGDQGNISHSLQTLEARGLLGIVRSPGGKAEALYLTAAGQKWARQFVGSCDDESSARKRSGWERVPATRDDVWRLASGLRLPRPQPWKQGGPSQVVHRTREKNQTA